MANRVTRFRRSKQPADRPSRGGILLRIIIVAVVFLFLGIAGLMLGRAIAQRGQQTEIPVNPDLNPLETTYLSFYLAANQSALNSPAGTDSTPIAFDITQGETASSIADRLASMNLVSDPELLRSYLRYYALDTKIAAGSYELNMAMNIPAVAQALSRPESPDVAIRLPEAWRREQIAAWLDTQPNLPFHSAEFLAATSAPSPEVAAAYQIPAGASLEGFLFPDTYRIDKNGTVSDLLTKALANFEQQVTAQMRADAQAQGMSIFQVVTLAAIVEREAVANDERPIIASVYLNRLAQGIKLDADPTVQYAMGYQPATDQWWNLGLTQDDYLLVDSPYNTYLYTGLPPGPIASPGLASIHAVIYPAVTPYIYFRAKCDGSGQHNFAVTYEEHLANGCP
jgi:UPF0755 protein